MPWVAGRAGGRPRSTTIMDTQNTPAVENPTATIKIAIDMHLKSYRVVRQLDFSLPQPARRFEPAKFYPWLAKQIAQARRGSPTHRPPPFPSAASVGGLPRGGLLRLRAGPAHAADGRRGAGDRPAALGGAGQAAGQRPARRHADVPPVGRLSLRPSQGAGCVVRIPPREEEARRARGRLREPLRRQPARMQAMGGSLLLQRELAVNGRWRKAATWQRIAAQTPPPGHRAPGSLETNPRADRAEARRAGSHPGRGRAQGTLQRRRRTVSR